MSNFLAWLWIIASCFFIVYLFKWVINRKRNSERAATYKKYALYGFLAGCAFLLGSSMTAPDDSTSTSNSDSSTSSSSSKPVTKKVVKKVTKKIDYTKAKTYKYGELVKSNDHAGEPYVIENAKVLQAQQENGQTALLVYLNDDSTQLILVNYPHKTAAIEDDYVTVKGTLGKLKTYDTQAGGSNTVPTINAKQIKVNN